MSNSIPSLFKDGTVVRESLKSVVRRGHLESKRRLDRGDRSAAVRAQEMRLDAERALDLIGELELFESDGLGEKRAFGSLIVYAARYAMGRKSYAVGEVTDWIEDHWDVLSSHVKNQIQEDIRRRVEDEAHARVLHDNPERKPPQPLGQDIDRERWLRILNLPTE